MTTKAFDTALYVPPNAAAGDAVEIMMPGPPLKTLYATYAHAPPNTNVAASIPAATAPGQTLVAGNTAPYTWNADLLPVPGLPVATAEGQALLAGPAPDYAWQTEDISDELLPPATAQDQVLISGPGPQYLWGPGTAPVQVPAPTGPDQILISGASAPYDWTTTTADAIASAGGAVMQATGGVFATAANLVYTPTTSLTVRLDGGDPAMSALDNFAIDAGTY